MSCHVAVESQLCVITLLVYILYIMLAGSRVALPCWPLEAAVCVVLVVPVECNNAVLPVNHHYINQILLHKNKLNFHYLVCL